MEALAVFLHIVLLITGIIVALCLLLLFVPLRYKLDGGYDIFFRANFCIRFTPILALKGQREGKSGDNLKLRIYIAGFSFALKPEKWGKEKKQDKKKDKSLSPLAVLRSLDKEFIGNTMRLLVDLLKILKPKKLEIKGKLGFSEPHYNGWLAAYSYLLMGCCRKIKLDIEPVWEEERYKFSFLMEGRLAVCVLLFRVARFMLARKTREFMKLLKKKKVSFIT